jgi:hypothetical protein
MEEMKQFQRQKEEEAKKSIHKIKDDCELKIKENKANLVGRFEREIEEMKNIQVEEMELFHQQIKEEKRKMIDQVKNDYESKIQEEKTKVTIANGKFQQQIQELKQKQKKEAKLFQQQTEDEKRKVIQQVKDDCELKIQAYKTSLEQQVKFLIYSELE